LGDVPLFGRLFSNDNSNKQKTDLVLLITPHVVRNMTRPDEASNQFASGTDSAIGSAPRKAPPLPVQINIVPAAPAKPADLPINEPVQVLPPPVSVVKPAVSIELSRQESRPDNAAVPVATP